MLNEVPIQQSLLNILGTCSDALTLFITDQDGVLVASVGEEIRSRQQIIASYYSSSDQINKLEIGPHKMSIYNYEQNQLIVMSFNTVTAFIYAKPTANTGMMLQLRNEIEKVIPSIEAANPMLIQEGAPSDPSPTMH